MAKLDQALAAYRPVGILLGDGEKIHLDAGVADGPAYVLWDNDGLTPRFERIGIVQGGKFREDGGAVSRYPLGSPVFALCP